MSEPQEDQLNNQGEKMRRKAALQQAVDGLLNTLLEHDEDFRREAQRRETTNVVSSSSSSSRSDSAASTSAEDTNVTDTKEKVFSRVEIVNQAICTINTVAKENQELAEMLNYMEQTPTE